MSRDFAAKTLLEISSAIEQSVFQTDLASKKGMLQAMDPRAKVLSIIMLLLFSALSRDPLPLLAVYLLTVMLALSSRVPLMLFIKRVWIFVPFFTGLVALPSVFNFITPGESVFTLATFAHPAALGPFVMPDTICITRQGLQGAGMLMLRVAVSVSLAVLLVLTTRWMDLLHALSVLKVPRTVILVLAMTYRYIHLFLRSLEGMLLARKSRQLSLSAGREERGWISSRLGVLAGKSYHLSTEVHLAMMSRGWTGPHRGLYRFRFTARDAVITAAAFLLSISGALFDKIC